MIKTIKLIENKILIFNLYGYPWYFERNINRIILKNIETINTPAKITPLKRKNRQKC
jgi:hypothetical protein